MARHQPPPPGFSRADLHVHTTFSDGSATPEDVLNYFALHSDCVVIAITDHDTLDGALHARAYAEAHPDLFGHLDVIVGEEVSSRDGHILGLFLEEWIPPGLGAAATVDAIHRQNGIAIAAHPYTSWMRWTGLQGVGDLIHELPFDAVETLNSNFTEVLANRKAARRAGSVACTGSSDGHFLDAIGRCYTDFPGRTAGDLRTAIHQATTIPGGRCYGLLTLLRYVMGRMRTGHGVVPHRRDFTLGTSASGLEIKVHRNTAGDTAVLELEGRLDEATSHSLKEKLVLLASARTGMVLRLDRLAALEPAGTTALVAGLRSARLAGVGFCLACPSPAASRALLRAGLHKAFPRARTVVEARIRVRRCGVAGGELPRGALRRRFLDRDGGKDL